VLIGAASVLALCAVPAPPASGHGDRRNTALAGAAADAATSLWSVQEPWDPSEHDARPVTTDQPDLTNLPTVHVIYLHGSDKPSQFTRFAAMFQADARKASRLLAQFRGGYQVRWDMRADSRDPARQILDITALKSSSKTNRLDSFSAIHTELGKRGFNNPNKKYAVFVDAQNPAACGQGTLFRDNRRAPDNANDVSRTTAVVFQAREVDAATGGWCRGHVLLHELGHNMGAVQPEAPNVSGAHCDDNVYDLMCAGGGATFEGPDSVDYNSDDYWDVDPLTGAGKLGHWTVNLSRFLCPPPLTGEASGCGRPNSPIY
jgi:hypothetical protein